MSRHFSQMGGIVTGDVRVVDAQCNLAGWNGGNKFSWRGLNVKSLGCMMVQANNLRLHPGQFIPFVLVVLITFYEFPGEMERYPASSLQHYLMNHIIFRAKSSSSEGCVRGESSAMTQVRYCFTCCGVAVCSDSHICLSHQV